MWSTSWAGSSSNGCAVELVGRRHTRAAIDPRSSPGDGLFTLVDTKQVFQIADIAIEPMTPEQLRNDPSSRIGPTSSLRGCQSCSQGLHRWVARTSPAVTAQGRQASIIAALAYNRSPRASSTCRSRPPNTGIAFLSRSAFGCRAWGPPQLFQVCKGCAMRAAAQGGGPLPGFGKTAQTA